ncbi:MAG: hypothetical protein QOG34_2251, partial [Frankiaceae bacterium]|nr:hypothetical protein [Frankiaceae bacterium]
PQQVVSGYLSRVPVPDGDAGVSKRND